MYASTLFQQLLDDDNLEQEDVSHMSQKRLSLIQEEKENIHEGQKNYQTWEQEKLCYCEEISNDRAKKLYPFC